MFDHVRRARRSLRVARTGARIYLGYRWTARRVRGRPAAEAALAWERRHTSAAHQLYRLAVELKGLFIKAGQLVGTRADIAPAPWVASLSRLQDSVPPRPVSLIRDIVERELGAPVGTLFASFDETPIAAASLAQVHRARLHDGRDVAVKVQYPEVEALVRLDLRNLRTVVALVARFEPDFDFRSIVAEMAAQFPLELDFAREARLMGEVAANLGGLPGIEVQRAIPGMVTRRVLVSEYIEGRRLLDAVGLNGRGPQVAAEIGAAYGHQILVDGLFQADPHPGNILVLPDGRIALIDFGLTKQLPERARVGFARLVVAASDRDPDGILAAFEDLGVRTRSSEPAQLFALMQLFFDAREPGRTGWSFRRDGEAPQFRRQLERIPGDLVLLGRVVSLLRGVCASLGADLTPMQMLRPFADQALARAESAPTASTGATA